ncbi:MAG: peptidase M20 [Henriciella sp.]|jgi:hippurate hydrolase|uniref:N(2)-acetyl-L-2,4-diaminobutanoate deacetylase DoeB2 n=1 Tax=Henriciella sp. TaxID=1968823 RepID=UPI000C0E717C|nr:peptidase M20 [Henriciella sp.]MBF34187.1 peptidase M20 [Hyphomonadaceae bacterium]MBK76597.1 peptidase M20 [Henriciella sp.]PHR75779.1 MAG: peptidase M20 [Henriciella sp.]|tara:strand:- start:1117 stop:2337 length:1221 start_codon:yes stop_codon:yes gene_type:complete
MSRRGFILPEASPSDWQALVSASADFRHDLHRHPELTWQEKDTAEIIRTSLARLDIDYRICAGTGTVATLAAGAKGRHVGLRADIDALPINESTGLDYSSSSSGCMHACGHDGHAAALMSTAAWLKRHEAELPGPVTLLFQPAEEGGHGARKMIEDGALDGLDCIFGWHNWPAIPFGKAVCPDGAVMAGNGTFRVTLKGAGGHASQPENTRDPVLAASAVTMALQQIISRRITPQNAAVVSVTSIEAPSGETVIPDSAKLAGSIRLANADDRPLIEGLIREITISQARAYGVEAEVEVFPRYDATVNHPAEAGRMREAIAADLGESWHFENIPVPIMASEDFSYYLKEIPGAFALIGADDGQGHHEPCHSPRYDFNDRLLPIVTRIYARLAGAPLPEQSTFLNDRT